MSGRLPSSNFLLEATCLRFHITIITSSSWIAVSVPSRTTFCSFKRGTMSSGEGTFNCVSAWMQNLMQTAELKIAGSVIGPQLNNLWKGKANGQISSFIVVEEREGCVCVSLTPFLLFVQCHKDNTWNRILSTSKGPIIARVTNPEADPAAATFTVERELHSESGS